ncbi:hypothetical protein Tco_1298055, partial [Tanacetum coccineum]
MARSVWIRPGLTGYGRVRQLWPILLGSSPVWPGTNGSGWSWPVIDGSWPGMAGFDRLWSDMVGSWLDMAGSWPDMVEFVRVVPLHRSSRSSDHQRTRRDSPEYNRRDGRVVSRKYSVDRDHHDRSESSSRHGNCIRIPLREACRVGLNHEWLL